MARCHVTLEKSSKNYISLFGGKPAKGLPTPPPTSLRAVTAHFPHVKRQVRTASARFTCENHSQEGGEGGVICETVPFDNGSSDGLQTQNQDSQYHCKLSKALSSGKVSVSTTAPVAITAASLPLRSHQLLCRRSAYAFWTGKCSTNPLWPLSANNLPPFPHGSNATFLSFPNSLHLSNSLKATKTW
jgi:hypothetical protein